MIDMPGNRVSSALRYMDSIKAKVELLMKAGDVVEINRRKVGSNRTVAQFKAECDKIKDLYLKGHSMMAISDELGIPQTTVRKRIKDVLKLEVRKKGVRRRSQKFTPEIDQKMLEMRKEGKTYEQIANKLSFPTSSVFCRFKKLRKEGLCQHIK